jgi:hypothetical protein
MFFRPDRWFIPNNRRAMKHLRYICREVLLRPHPPKSEPKLKEEEETVELEHLKSVCMELDSPVRDVLLMFLSFTMEADLFGAMAEFLYLLCHNGEVSAVFPPQFHDHVLELCKNVQEGVNITQHFPGLLFYCAELQHILDPSIADEEVSKKVAKCVEYLVQQIQDIHSSDHTTDPVSEMEGTYNPPSGTCYYFSESGNQKRKIPHYSVETDTNTGQKCTKNFPQVSYGGFGYLQIFFCPVHGHCYGCHLIAGGEGAKDVFAPLYKYKESPPAHIFYDFACQLSEYIMNREPEFFMCTRCWHDIFHGFNHTACGCIFQSTRITGLEGVNSSICEQFNSYLQCMKYTGSHLSQPHFMLFAQFFMYLWNTEKSKRYKGIVSVVLSGVL